MSIPSTGGGHRWHCSVRGLTLVAMLSVAAAHVGAQPAGPDGVDAAAAAPRVVAPPAQALPDNGPAGLAAQAEAPRDSAPRSDPFHLSLSIGVDSGILWGMASELVYIGSYKLSELDYPLQPVIYAGGRIEAETAGGLAASLHFSAGIPTWTGFMTDSDWDYFDYPPIPPGVKTNFSESSSYLERAIFLDARIGWKLQATPALQLEPFLAYKYIDIKWSAHNGYLQYPPETSAPYTAWSPSEPKTNIYGTVLTYNQTFMIPAGGIKIVVRPWRMVTIDGAFAFSPFAFLNDVDEHPLRYLIFYDSMTSGLYFEPQLGISWQATGVLELSLRLSYLSISEPNNGNIVMLDTNPNDSGYGTPTLLTGESSGATLSAFGAEIGASLRF